jgi:hypothetical protein
MQAASSTESKHEQSPTTAQINGIILKEPALALYKMLWTCGIFSFPFFGGLKISKVKPVV